jgi:RNA polymerase sigma factor (TIGR02999 family)
MESTQNTTQLFRDARQGKNAALDALFPIVYAELRGIAHKHRARQRASDTITTTALVHEAYLKLVDGQSASWQDRAHFFALASRAMRFVLVDHARASSAQKRGAGARDVSLDEALIPAEDRSEDLVAIDEALTRLQQHSERLADLVQYRFFGGMSYEEIAEVTGLSVPTVKRDWARARTWLYQFMRESS